VPEEPPGPGIQVWVNGEAHRVPAGSTIADLVRILSLDRARIAVEHNLRVVPRAEHASLHLNHGDKLEIVTFVGGGSADASGQRAARRPWTLTSSAFERLLLTLDEDRERAALAYEQLRRRITGLMEWWGATASLDLADQTLDRVARKLEEGAVIADGSLGAYVRGVARMVFHEAARRQRDLPHEGDRPAPPPADESEAALACLDRCLDSLAGGDRDLVLRYYDIGTAAEVRRRLAGELGISPIALRVRTHRLRERLEECVTGCLGQG
jgi:sulfur carrier protein